MPVWMSKKSWGKYTADAAQGKVRPWKRKAANASQDIKWRKSKKQTCITPAKARGMHRP